LNLILLTPMPEDYFDEQKSGEFGQDKTPVYRLSKSQKIMASLLAFFALFVIILWSVQFKKTLTSPFTSSESGTNNETSNSSAAGEQSLAELTSKDTDTDGLSDYDELYVYKTSPYLEDSDSDGFNDGKEITDGTNPNCPVGQNCFSSTNTTDNTANNTGTNSSNNISTSSLDSLMQADNSQALTSTDQEAIKQAVDQSMDVATLRQLLLDKGMDQAMLDKISDEELMKSFEEILNQ